jgi:hypothetical protein
MIRLLSALVALLVTEAADRLLPKPPLPPEQRATMLASDLAAWLWDRYRDPAGDPHSSTEGRLRAILYAAVLDEDDVRRLARYIQAEHADGPDAPPLSYEVVL